MGVWRKTSKWKRAMVARLLKRDGHDCWLCGFPMTQPPKKHTKRISLEHLTPRILGGGDVAENLVLCHQHCNGHLRDHPREKKLVIREKWMAYRSRIASPARST
jgi:5-methylcytosine-specific restriction endonuclease McrA